jgi:hypothetical protein
LFAILCVISAPTGAAKKFAMQRQPNRARDARVIRRSKGTEHCDYVVTRARIYRFMRAAIVKAIVGALLLACFDADSSVNAAPRRAPFARRRTAACRRLAPPRRTIRFRPTPRALAMVAAAYLFTPGAPQLPLARVGSPQLRRFWPREPRRSGRASASWTFSLLPPRATLPSARVGSSQLRRFWLHEKR